MRARWVWAAACAAALTATPGCRSPYAAAPVSGTVMTCEGKPAEGGVVTFTPLDDPGRTGRPAGHAGWASSGTVGPDGRFTLTALDGRSGDGALIGPHRV